MNKVETAKILAILKSTYPAFYKDMKTEDINNTINIWAEMFKEEPYELIAIILKEVIATSEYPPTIATIKKKISEISKIEEESNSELWEKLLKAIRNGYYGAEEEFKKLPDIIKEFIGSPEQLRSIAEMDSDTIHSVVKGQFFKQIENLKERAKTRESLSPEVKNLLFGKDTKYIENLN